MKPLLVLVFFIFSQNQSRAQTEGQMHEHKEAKAGHMEMAPTGCSDRMVWDFALAACRPLGMAGAPMKMWMLHANAFGAQNFAEKPRGRNNFSVPNMFMGDVGSSVGSRHYLNVGLMLTFEKWTFPSKGHPEFLQIGEIDEDHLPYVDAQHPHSSPIMGLTISDTIGLNDDKNHVKIFFSPRGPATDGPVPFMHRATGMVNPDAPLGHHIGQDVSHISSTVIGSSWAMNKWHLEASVFNGSEPEPTEVDLPLGELNSFATRIIWEFSDSVYAMASAANIKSPEPHDPAIDKNYRYSGSIYYQRTFDSSVMVHNALIFGVINFYDHFSKLRSITEEFLMHAQDSPHNVWGRLELVERGADQLQIDPAEGPPKWVHAITFGYTHDLIKTETGKLGIGISATKIVLPKEFQPAYGGNPMAGKIILQLSSMKMALF